MSNGPELELVERFSLAQEWVGYGHDPRAEGLRERVAAAETWDDLSAADRAFLEEALAAVEDGDTFEYNYVPADGPDEPKGFDFTEVDDDDWVGV